MEEKKKRWRPSLTAYRELESKLQEQIDGTSRLIADCRDWRQKFWTMKDERDVLKSKLLAADQSNGHVEEEIQRLRREVNTLEQKNDALCQENYSLRHRGFWARVFNKIV